MLWGTPAVFWGSTVLEMHSSGTEPVTFFWGTILAWGAHFLPGGDTSSDLRGAWPRNAPRGAGPGFLPPQKRLFW